MNTLIYVVVVVVTGLVGGLIAALILWRSTPLASVTFDVVIFVWAMPPLVNASVWRFLLDQRGLVDSIPAVFHIPPVLWLADGRLPLVAVALVNAWAVVVLGVVTTFYAFRSFDFIFIMTSGGPSTVSTTLP